MSEIRKDGNEYLISISDLEKCEIETLPPPESPAEPLLSMNAQMAMIASAIAIQQETMLPIFSRGGYSGLIPRSVNHRSLLPVTPLPDGAYARYNRDNRENRAFSDYNFFSVSMTANPVNLDCIIKIPILEMIAFTPSKHFEEIKEKETGDKYKFHIETF